MNDHKLNPPPFEMAEHARQLRLVLDNINLPICYYGRDLVVHFVNRQYAELLDLPESQILGRSLPEIIGESLFEQVRAHFDRALSGAQVTYERDRTWPGRPQRRIRISLFPDIGPGGAIHGIYAVGHDIDEDHRLRGEFKEREEQLIRFADKIPEPLIYLDRDLRYRFVNRAFLEYRNVSREQVVGRTVEEVRGTDFANDLQPLVEQAYKGLPTIFERENRMEDGTLRWSRARLVPDLRPDGTVEGVYAVIVDIDEMKRAQEALREAESHLRLFTDNTPDPLAYLDANLRFSFVNQAYIDGVNAPRERIIGQSIASVLGEEAAVFFEPYIEQARAGKRTSYERLRPAPDGQLRWVRGVLVPDYDRDHQFKGIYIVVHDIHDLKLAQAALAQREGQMRAFMDGIPTPVAYINNQGRYEYVNRAFVEFSEIGLDQIQGRMPREILSDEDFGRQAALLARALEGEQIEYGQLASFSNRPSRWMQVRLVPDREGEAPIRGVFILLNDIHAQKENEAAIQRINWVLSSHIENTPMAVVEWDKHLDLIRWSPRAEAIFGWKAEEVLGTSLRQWKLVFGDDVPKVDAVIQSMLMGERSSTTSMNRNIRRDGSIIWCEWHNSVLRDENGDILSILSFAQDVSDRVDAQEKLEAMATHDALTGLPNRALLHLQLAETLDRARHRQRQVAVLFIDLDRFKNVNDSLGHRMGDELLRMIGRRLGLALRKGDFLARLGGDEFTVLLENLEDAEGAAQVAAKLLEVIQQPYWVHGHAVHVSASIGLSIFPDDGDDPDTLLKNADVAMYRAKDAGKNVYQFFAQEMGAQQQEQMALETALRWAVKNEDLMVRYQPKVDIATGRIVGAEALLRWHDAILGDVPPARFIPLAEESGLIDIMGDWVLKQACFETQQWVAAGLVGMTIAINLSVRQFRDAGFAARIQKIFADTGVDPHRVEFEVTETSVLYDAETVGRVLQLERELGVRVAIDDFGTGYSSLVHLKRLPIDTLKIDQSFIRDITTDPDDKAITAAIIALAHSLGLDVVAEGVETAEQLAFLTERGCNYYQGHYFSEPLESAAFIDLVSRHQGEAAQEEDQAHAPIV
jgi:diguanylate cyclase (GGDEF)-like protein/PAS domain S-box-containing protein